MTTAVLRQSHGSPGARGVLAAADGVGAGAQRPGEVRTVEVAAQIQEHAFDYLDAPVARLAAPFSPVPFSPALEQHYLPSADRIAAEIRGTLARPGA